MNDVFISGRLTNDIVIRYTQSNKAVTTFTLAVTREYNKDGSESDFIRCQAWEGTANYLKDYVKGDWLSIRGTIRTGSYEDRNSGKKIYTTDVLVSRIDQTKRKKAKEEQESFEPIDNIPEGEKGFLPF